LEIFDPISFQSQKKIITQFRPDLCHLHNLHGGPSLSSISASSKSNVPSLLHIHDYWLLCAGCQLFQKGKACELHCQTCSSNWWGIRRSLIKKTIQKVERVVVASQYVKDRFVESGLFQNELIEILPYFVDSKRFSHDLATPDSFYPRYKLPSDKLIILSMSALTKAKGLDGLVSAFSRVGEENAVLVLAGDGPERDALNLQAKKSGIEKQVIFTGPIPPEDISHIYCAADIVCLPSIWPEPFGLVALEAMASEKPLIASDIGGIPEVVGESQRLVPAADEVSLADALSEFLTSKKLRKKIGVKARKRAKESFSPKNHLLKLTEIYTGLASN
ncbi:MAG: glycosyltransferase family 4 protein, partial [Candidatus Altiarchaeota archaeon]